MAERVVAALYKELTTQNLQKPIYLQNSEYGQTKILIGLGKNKIFFISKRLLGKPKISQMCMCKS